MEKQLKRSKKTIKKPEVITHGKDNRIHLKEETNKALAGVLRSALVC